MVINDPKKPHANPQFSLISIQDDPDQVRRIIVTIKGPTIASLRGMAAQDAVEKMVREAKYEFRGFDANSTSIFPIDSEGKAIESNQIEYDGYAASFVVHV